jgi:hypothetical protein
MSDMENKMLGLGILIGGLLATIGALIGAIMAGYQ